MTVRMAISVEGPTEYEFCREVLGPHLRTFNVFAEAKIIVTKTNIAGSNAKGGGVSVDRVVSELKPLLHSFDYVTTLYDFYGFKGRLVGETPDELGRRISQRLGEPRNFLPYVQKYEFESLLFSSPEIVGRAFASAPLARALQAAVDACGGAEQVNDSVDTTPSRRLMTAFSTHLIRQVYDKKFHGPYLLLEMGLPTVRQACPRFNGWMVQLERLTKLHE